MAINYNPTQWNNEQEPPISADNLNHIEQGIKSTADRVDELVTVEANPSGTPTDRLTGLEVDGNIYEVGGGHKVYTDGGTLLPQQPNMVVKGVYSKDNAADSMTEIEVVREFQNDAEVQALTGEAAKGFQHTPDNIYRARAAADITFDPTNTLLTQTRMQEAMEELDAEHLPYSSTQNVKQKIDDTGTCTLLATLTAAETEYSLSQSVSNFKTIIAESYLTSNTQTTYILATINVPVAEWTAGRNVIPCFNDGTIRKAQFNILSATSVKTAGSNGGFMNITGVRIYGVK